MFLVDDVLIGSAIAIIHKKRIWYSISKKLTQSFNIWKGLFLTDSQLSVIPRIWTILSRFSWELPQTILGFLIAVILNWTNRLDWVNHKYGSTSLKLSGLFGGMSLAPFIIGDEQLIGASHNHLFQHEFGHIMQSKIWGPLYLLIIGLPSLVSAIVNDYNTHMRKWQEQDANKRARSYFNQKNEETFSWNYEKNPIL